MTASTLGDSIPLKVCLFSYDFPPLVGGLVHFAMGLGPFLVRRGADVTVVTTTAAGGYDHGLPYKVVRQPTWSILLDTIARSDVLHLNGFALMPCLAAFLKGRPVV